MTPSARKRQQRRGLHRFALRGGVAVRRGQRPDQPFHQRADNGGRGDVGVELRQMAAGGGRLDARGKLGGERLAEGAPQAVELRLDRLHR